MARQLKNECEENVQIFGSVSWARDRQHLQHLNSCGLLFSASIVHDIQLPSSIRWIRPVDSKLVLELEFQIV